MQDKIRPFIGSIEGKDINGETWYRIVTVPKKLIALGYFPSEEKAKQALRDYLIANGKIDADN